MSSPAGPDASAVTVQGSRHQIEIQLGHLCNNRCVFCESGLLTEMGLARPVPLEPIVAALEQAASEGVRKVTFLGGEPTLQKSFLPALKRAVELGFGEIVIFTNGMRTPSLAFIDEVVALGRGRVTWRFSIQGGNEEAHDGATRKKGAFAKIVQGLAYLQERGEPVTANVCINELSYRSLPDYPALITRFGIRQLHVDMFRPGDLHLTSEEQIRAIMCRYSDMAPYLRSMLERFESLAPDFDVNVGNYPYCLLPEWSHRIHHGGETTLTLNAEGGGTVLSDPVDKYVHQRHDMVYAPECERCVFRPGCRGVPEKYAQFHGTGELHPVSLERLRVMDPEQNHFVLLVEAHLAPLLAAPAPDGWTAEEVFRSSRDRRFELRYRDRRGKRVQLIFTPPAGVGRPASAPEPVLVTNRYRMSLLAEAGGGPPSIAALAVWAEARLRESPGVEVHAAVDADRVSASLADPRRLRRAQALVARYAQRLQRRERYGDWRYRTTRPIDDGLGAVMAFEGPGGRGVSLALEVQSDPQRPLVGATFHLKTGTSPEDARAVVDDLTAALRG